MDTLKKALEKIAHLPHDEECNTQMEGREHLDCSCHVDIAERALIARTVKLGSEVDRPLYDTVHLSTTPVIDAVGCRRPSGRDRLVQEVVVQVLSWSRKKQEHVRRELGPPQMSVAVATSWAGHELCEYLEKRKGK